jgi:hypothetical protein
MHIQMDDYPTHSCDAKCGRVSLLQVHDRTTELIEKLPLQGLGIEVTNHFFCGTILNREFVVADSVGDKVESTIEVFSPLAA